MGWRCGLVKEYDGKEYVMKTDELLKSGDMTRATMNLITKDNYIESDRLHINGKEKNGYVNVK